MSLFSSMGLGSALFRCGCCIRSCCPSMHGVSGKESLAAALLQVLGARGLRVGSIRPRVGGQGGDGSGRMVQWAAIHRQVILWAVRWYLQFPISYRDLELMLQDRGVSVDHTTIFRWIQAYAPKLEKRIRPHLRTSNGSWRVDETYVKVKGRWTYLYRARVQIFRRLPTEARFCPQIWA